MYVDYLAWGSEQQIKPLDVTVIDSDADIKHKIRKTVFTCLATDRHSGGPISSKHSLNRTDHFLCANDLPCAVFFSTVFGSGRALFRIFKNSAVRARIRECRYALEHLMW